MFKSLFSRSNSTGLERGLPAVTIGGVALRIRSVSQAPC